MKTKGWKNVFGFTFIQTVKARSFIVSTIVMSVIILVMSAGINLLPGLLSDSDSSDISDAPGSAVAGSPISHVYVLDETGIEGGVDFSSLEALGYKFENITSDMLDAKIAEVNGASTSVALLEMMAGEGAYSILIGRPADTEAVTSDQCNTLVSYASALLKNTVLMSCGVAPEALAQAQSSIHSTITVAGEEPQSMIEQIVNSMLPMLSSLVLFIFIFAYGQMVAQSVAIEKTSRVMELLLTSIKPLAVIIGKVLAMCCVSLLQFLILGTVGFASFTLLLPMGSLSTVTTGAMIDNVPVTLMDEIGAAFSGFSPLSIILILVIFILGFLFYALVAGLIGASISKMEDLASAMQPLSILGVLGFYLAYFPVIFEVEATAGEGPNVFTILSYYLPVSSPFALPSAMLTGKLEMHEVIISIAALLAFVIIMAIVVAKVYHHIVLHSGNRLKLGEMIKMAKSK